MKRLTVPQLSANIVEVTVTRWIRQQDQEVRAGEPLVEVTTDKAAFELESPADGLLLQQLCPEKSIVPVGYALALVGSPGETDPDVREYNRRCMAQAQAERAGGTPAAEAPVETSEKSKAPGPAPNGRVRATPKARRLAREQNIDLAVVAADSGNGVVTEHSLQTWIEQKTARAADTNVAEEVPPRVAWVTGGSRGIGRAIALALSRLGWKVAVQTCEHAEAAEQVVAEMRKAGCDGLVVKGDVANADDVIRVHAEIRAKFGDPLVLVNAAGIIRTQYLLLTRPKDWERILAVNLEGAFLTLQCVSRGMMRARWGRIVNIGSVAGLGGDLMRAPYAASKAGLQGLSCSAARELASTGITVNLVAPGVIQTAMTSDMPEKRRERLLANIPMQRFGTPEEVAGVVCFLVSEDAAYITGETLVVDGGLYLRR